MRRTPEPRSRGTSEPVQFTRCPGPCCDNYSAVTAPVTRRCPIARARSRRGSPARRSRDRCVRTARSAAASSIFHRDGKLVSIEGDPGSPISEGHLCPKGAATLRAADARGARRRKVKYRAPFATDWQDLASRDRARHDRRPRVGRRARKRSYSERDGLPLMQCAEHRAPRRRDARQRRELPDQEAVRRRPRHGRDQQSGPDMT